VKVRYGVANKDNRRVIEESRLEDGTWSQRLTVGDGESVLGGHSHQVSELFTLVSGKGTYALDTDMVVEEMNPGDSVDVPTGVGHIFRLAAHSVMVCHRSGPHAEDEVVRMPEMFDLI